MKKKSLLLMVVVMFVIGIGLFSGCAVEDDQKQDHSGHDHSDHSGHSH